MEKQLLVKEPFRNTEWSSSLELKTLLPPGLQDIKWLELYSKWGKFVPEDRKQGLKYYVNEPPKELKNNIRKQAREAKTTRNKRTRGAAADKENNASISNKRKSGEACAVAFFDFSSCL